MNYDHIQLFQVPRMLRRLHILKEYTDLTQPALEEFPDKIPQKTKSSKTRPECPGNVAAGSSTTKGKRSIEGPSCRVVSNGTSAACNSENIESTSGAAANISPFSKGN